KRPGVGPKRYIPERHNRRSHGKDAVHYNSARFICAAVVDGDNDSEVDEDVPQRGKQDSVRANGTRGDIGLDEDPAYAPPALHEISLLDLAKPAKPRVSAARRGGYEMVGTVSQVITLEAEDGQSIMEGEDDDWIYVEEDAQPRRTYFVGAGVITCIYVRHWVQGRLMGSGRDT
ncbi:hypothetical protein B0H21DRAFT_709478, partial [Amylocystis lapponica]